MEMVNDGQQSKCGTVLGLEVGSSQSDAVKGATKMSSQNTFSLVKKLLEPGAIAGVFCDAAHQHTAAHGLPRVSGLAQAISWQQEKARGCNSPLYSLEG